MSWIEIILIGIVVIFISYLLIDGELNPPLTYWEQKDKDFWIKYHRDIKEYNDWKEASYRNAAFNLYTYEIDCDIKLSKEILERRKENLKKLENDKNNNSK